MSEDLSEGEKGDLVGDLSSHGDSTRGRMPRISSVDVMENWANQHKEKKLYIVLIRHELKPFHALSLYEVLWVRIMKFERSLFSLFFRHKKKLGMTLE